MLTGPSLDPTVLPFLLTTLNTLQLQSLATSSPNDSREEIEIGYLCALTAIATCARTHGGFGNSESGGFVITEDENDEKDDKERNDKNGSLGAKESSTFSHGSRISFPRNKVGNYIYIYIKGLYIYSV